MEERTSSPSHTAAEDRDDADLLRLLVASVQDYAIFRLTPEGRVASWNAGAERIKGYRAGEIIGKHFSVFYPREDVDGGKCEYELEVAARDGRFEDEGWRVRKDGTMFWANVIITAMRDETGTLRGFAKVTRDLTPRLRAEQERIDRARAEEGERRREEFLAIMGHELRNPLSPMLTAVHLIKLRHGVQCEREIAVLDRQLVQMMRLLDDLLDISRMLRNKVELSTKTMEIGAVLANAVDASASRIEQKSLVLRLDVPPESLCVDVDVDRMTQVFSNLLNNAAKYTEEGGEILVGARGDDAHVEVSIADTGVGIAPEALTRIFELFAQETIGAGRQLGGFGIGLSVAKRLVLAHGGAIRAESAGLGRGSRFVVSLPRSFSRAESALASPPPARRASVQRRVLVVDDNRDCGEMVEALLRALGHEVRTALDGVTALEVAQDFEPEIAFLDLGLPGMNGFDLARQLRRIPACATIPIFAVSGYARERDRQAALEAGFTEHFAKPFDLDRLETLVERANAHRGT